ncbi:hypothetical protein KOW79_004859 [Hemibagrus wyckioides]|uniref:Uncharacterized protein n=1 Tax=Hemibagrus wyckioides TaxID=337641 RepID=A0A9D3SPM3_9TELE|nr:hypothetical protein KOW79_004859 [Hemibagrus wyckioides]
MGGEELEKRTHGSFLAQIWAIGISKGPAGRELECITKSPSSRSQFKIWGRQEIQKVQQRKVQIENIL